MRSRKPKVNVFNRQRKYFVEMGELRIFLDQLSCQMTPQTGFSVVLVSDAAMRNYNREFRGKNGSADVLSFPNQEDEGDEEPYLGDILICVEAAARQEKDGLLQELQVLSLHGLLHLLGYDHDADQGAMETLERKLRREFQLH
ncbi:MAG: rRNA maturation RNase YbeY [Acidobacteria bacterium]|nr:MAG: rRNA maturation RNase YbeY [Acidobacteriota bacterium]